VPGSAPRGPDADLGRDNWPTRARPAPRAPRDPAGRPNRADRLGASAQRQARPGPGATSQRGGRARDAGTARQPVSHRRRQEPAGRADPVNQAGDADWQERLYRPDHGNGAGGPGRRPGSGRPPRRPPRQASLRQRYRPVLRVLLALATTFIVITGWSVGHALTYPGGGTFSERLAEWARDHQLGFVVTFGEWLTYQPPKKGGKAHFTYGPSAVLTKKAKCRAAAHRRTLAAKVAVCNAERRRARLSAPPARLASFAGRPIGREGRWRVLGTVNGIPAIWGTEVRFSRVYSSYVAGVVSMNPKLLRFELRPGVEDPGGSNWGAQPYIPPGTRSKLKATFNSGFKIASSGGGFYLNHHTVGTLQKGVASEVYYRNGGLRIGVWDQNVWMTSHVVGVRQNLHLIVNHGQVPSDVNNSVSTNWGATLGGGYYVWRSGIGETRDGRIIFAYGPAMDVRQIAEVLKRAGCVQAMELDINPDWMSFMYYLPKRHPGNPTPYNLLPDQLQPPTRYFSISSRDFTAVYAK
jgi:hypothetical protein